MNGSKNQSAAASAGVPRTGGNENTGLIKLIAIACMIVDHVGVAFFPRVYELRVIGRIAFPLFAWCLCVGSVYTRNVWKYALRLLIVGILVQPVYAWAMNHEWNDLNIFFELLIGLLAIVSIRENRLGSRYWGPVLSMIAVCALPLNYSYGWQGLLFILLLYACRQNGAAIGGFMIAFCMYWGHSSTRLTRLFGLELPTALPYLSTASVLLSDLWRVQFWAILALPLMAIPMRSRLRLPKWVPYAAYPVHLAVIGLIRHWNEVSLFFSQWL